MNWEKEEDSGCGICFEGLGNFTKALVFHQKLCPLKFRIKSSFVCNLWCRLEVTRVLRRATMLIFRQSSGEIRKLFVFYKHKYRFFAQDVRFLFLYGSI